MNTIEEFHLIGITVRTTNENGQSAQDIPGLWNQFFAEHVFDQIPNKISNSVYCVYTDYEKDHTAPYTTIIGCQVASLDEIPEEMIGKTIPKNNYRLYPLKGNLREGLVIQKWMEIWGTDLPRNYIADFEIYDEHTSDPTNAKVDLFIGIDFNT